MSAMVSVQDLRKSYGERQAVRGISFQVAQGETFGLLGSNGAGKTTTVECIVGLREPDGGRVEIGGIDARRSPREANQLIGAALQTTALQDKITPREALRLFGAFYRTRREPDLLLDRFDLADKADAPFDSLSGGQRQRLALALALVNDPKVLVLDEPTAGLDPRARLHLRDLLQTLRADRRAILLTTHDLHEAELLCDRLAIIDEGWIVASGPPSELIAAHGQSTLEDVFMAVTGATIADDEKQR